MAVSRVEAEQEGEPQFINRKNMVCALSESKYRELLAWARIISREPNQKCKNNLEKSQAD